MHKVTGSDWWHGKRSRTRYLLRLGVALVVVLVSTAWWVASARDVVGTVDPALPPSAVPERPLPAPRANPARRAASLVSPEAPAQVRLPSGQAVPVVAVSTRAGRTLDVPDDVFTAGWWRGGSRIGDPFGSVLIAGHVDSRTQGLGLFAELLSVRPHQQVLVTTRHLRQLFAIRSLRLVRQGSLAAHGWISAPTGDPRLTLVTCAPPYAASRGGYQNLAVIQAVPVGPPTRTARR